MQFRAKNGNHCTHCFDEIETQSLIKNKILSSNCVLLCAVGSLICTTQSMDAIHIRNTMLMQPSVKFGRNCATKVQWFSVLRQ